MGQIVHFGLGNFARAHILDYTADTGGGWQVTGVNLRSSATRDGLAAQDFKYALNVQGTGIKQISVIKTVLLASESQQAVLEAMAMLISSRQPSPKRATIWIRMDSLTCMTR